MKQQDPLLPVLSFPANPASPDVALLNRSWAPRRPDPVIDEEIERAVWDPEYRRTIIERLSRETLESVVPEK